MINDEKLSKVTGGANAAPLAEGSGENTSGIRRSSLQGQNLDVTLKDRREIVIPLPTEGGNYQVTINTEKEDNIP